MESLFDGLIAPNCFVTVTGMGSVTQDDAGGSLPVYDQVLATDVPVLASLKGGLRDGRFAMRLMNATGTMSGDNDALAAQDARLTFTDATEGNEFLIGLIVEMRSISIHQATPDGWIPKRITIGWSQVGYVEPLT